MNNVKDALEKLKQKGVEGSYPKGCIHDRDDLVEFSPFATNQKVRICSACLSELLK